VQLIWTAEVQVLPSSAGKRAFINPGRAALLSNLPACGKSATTSICSSVMDQVAALREHRWMKICAASPPAFTC
jgi:hypothetical protein